MSNKAKSQAAKAAVPASMSAPVAPAAPAAAAAIAVSQPAPRPPAKVLPVAESSPTPGFSREQALQHLAAEITDEPPVAASPDPDAAALEDNDETPLDDTAPADEANLTDPDAPEAAAATETDDEPDDDLNELAKLDDEQLAEHGKAKGWPASYVKRVNKFTRQLREAQEESGTAETLRAERDALQARLEETETNPPVTPAPGAPIAASTSEQKVRNEIAQRERILDAIDGHLESDDGRAGLPLVIGEQSWTPTQLRAEKRRYTGELDDHRLDLRLMQREQKEVRQGLEQQAVERHPWLKDKRNPNTALVENALRDFPTLQHVPGIRLLLANNVAWNQHQAALKARAGTNGNGNGNGNGHAATNGDAPRPAAPAARAPGRPAAAPLPPSRREQSAQVSQEAVTSGDRVAVGHALMSLVTK